MTLRGATVLAYGKTLEKIGQLSPKMLFSLGDGRRLNFMEGLLVRRASLMHYFPLSF